MPNDIKALYFVLTSVLIIIVLLWRTWYEIFVAENNVGVGVIAIEIIRFSPAAGFIAMPVFLAGVMTMLEMIRKSMYRQGVIAGEERGRVRGLSRAASWYQRKLDAEARGEPFNEPPPWETNGSVPMHFDDEDANS